MDFTLAQQILIHTQHTPAGRRWVISADHTLGSVALRSPVLVEFLQNLPRAFTESAARDALISLDAQAADTFGDLWNLLIAKRVIVKASDSPAQHRIRAWRSNGWNAASFAHEASRNYPFMDMGAPEQLHRDADMMAQRAADEPPPSPFLQIPHVTRIPLQPVDTCLPQAGSYKTRHSLQSLSVLVGLPFGKRRSREINPGVSVIRKSIPSGGSRHPTEAFLAVFDHPAVPQGIYHYNVEHHALDLAAEGDFFAQFRSATSYLFQSLQSPPWLLSPPWACLFLGSHVERAMWRYRDPRSFRAVLIDIGHATAAFQHTAQALGYYTVCEGRFHDQELYQLLPVDKLSTPILEAVAIFP